MRRDDRSADRKSETHAMRFRREEWLEDALGPIGRETAAGILDTNDTPSIGALQCQHAQYPLLGGLIAHRLDSVGKKVDEDLLKLDPIAAHARYLRREFDGEHDTAAAQSRAHQVDRSGDHLVQIDAHMARWCHAEHRADVRHDVGCISRGRDDALRRVTCTLDVCIVARQPAQAGLRVRNDCCQRLVHVMHERRCEFAERRQVRGARDLRMNMRRSDRYVRRLGHVCRIRKCPIGDAIELS